MENVAPCRDTSAQSLAQVGMKNFALLTDKIEDICIGAQLNGALDLSGREIQARYEFLHGTRIDASTVSSRINSLVAAGRLVRAGECRLCTVTGRNIHPVYVPLKQARLLA